MTISNEDLRWGTGRVFASVAGGPIDDRQTNDLPPVGGIGTQIITSSGIPPTDTDCEEIQEDLNACELSLGELQAENDALSGENEELQDQLVDNSGNYLQFQITHIGDYRETFNNFTWDFFNRFLTVMTAPSNGFTTYSTTFVYSYYEITDEAVPGTGYPPADTGINVSFRAQKPDTTWVAGTPSGGWGPAFMGVTAGDYVPIQAKLTDGIFAGVVVDTDWFDIGGYTYEGIIDSAHVNTYTSLGYVSRDERDGV